MPNWCKCELMIYSDDEKIWDYIKGKNGELDFAEIICPPNTPAYNDEFETSQSEIKHDPTFWYNWNVENWGTKWNAGDVIREDTRILFETAWSPPLPVIHRLGELFPNAVVGLQYREYGCGFEGEYIMSNGVLYYEDERSLPMDFETTMLEAYDKLEEE